MPNPSEGRDDEVIHFIPDPAREGSRRERLADRWRERQQSVSAPAIRVERPEHLPADLSSWWGGRRESAAVARHNQQLDRMYYARSESETAIKYGLGLEAIATRGAMRTLAAEEEEFLRYGANSLPAQAGERVVMESVQRILNLVTDLSEDYRRRVLNG